MPESTTAANKIAKGVKSQANVLQENVLIIHCWLPRRFSAAVLYANYIWTKV
jgi:hypothetical protein